MPASCPRIRRVRQISSFGLFRSFVPAPALPDFDRYNLIYGWNYSGKTTFARVLQCLEQGRLSPDCPSAAFTLELTDGSTVTHATQPVPVAVRVFNRDFVDKNFHQGSDMTGAPAIAVIGAENKELKDRLALLGGRLAKVQGVIDRLAAAADSIQQQLDNAGTAKARDIDRIFGERFRRDHLFGVVARLPTDAAASLLSETALKGKLVEWRNASEFQTLAELAPDHGAYVRAVLRLRNALQSAATNRAIARLRANPAISNWVSAGLHLHAAEATCEFCGNVVSAGRWEDLRAHFSQEYRALHNEVAVLHQMYSGFPSDISVVTSRDVFPELHPRFIDAKAELEEAAVAVACDVGSIASQLNRKLQELEVRLSPAVTLASAKRLRAAIRSYNTVISEHNRRVNSAAEVKTQARAAILNHYAAEFERESSFRAQKRRIGELESRKAEALTTYARIQTRISETDLAIKTASIGPKLINENLALLLPGDDIQAVKLNDTDFQFQRCGVPAARMSDGERTAVAFAYFLAKLDEGAMPISERILVIDDPISSLDSNHIYAVHGILEAKLSKANQLFVLTHNAAFFGMTRDWIKKRNGQLFMTHRQMGPGRVAYSELITLPRLLRQFKSDYQYTYYCLRAVDAQQEPTLESLCGVPNMVRRLLEAYLGFVFPESGGWGDKLERLFPDPAKCAAVKKFADDNSHAHSLAQAMEVANYISHSKEVVRYVLGALRAHNPAHIQSLEAELDPAKGALP